MKYQIFLILFIATIAIKVPPKDDDFSGKKRSREQPSILNYARPIHSNNEVASAQTKNDIIQRANSAPTITNNNRFEKETFQIRRTNSASIKKPKIDLETPPINIDNDIQRILPKDNNNKVVDTYNTIKFKNASRTSCLFKGVMHCIKAFLDYVEQSKPTCDGANGNSGYFTLVNSQNKEMSIYQYGRIDKNNNHVHSEEELIDILKKIKLKNYTVLMSSFYSPCLGCQKKIKEFLASRPNVEVIYYYFKKYPDFGRGKSKILGRLQIYKVNYKKNKWLQNYRWMDDDEK